jgi:hypothetical protein
MWGGGGGGEGLPVIPEILHGEYTSGLLNILNHFLANPSDVEHLRTLPGHKMASQCRICSSYFKGWLVYVQYKRLLVYGVHGVPQYPHCYT